MTKVTILALLRERTTKVTILALLRKVGDSGLPALVFWPLSPGLIPSFLVSSARGTSRTGLFTGRNGQNDQKVTFLTRFPDPLFLTRLLEPFAIFLLSPGSGIGPE